MGCDIHMYTEKRIKGKWECVDPVENDEGELKVPFGKRVYQGRSPLLFTLLANVNNNDDDGYVTPISEPKGLPKDVSDIVKKMSDQWDDYEGHSHSYYTLKELLEYIMGEPTTKKVGFVPKEEWIQFQESLKTPTPNYYIIDSIVSEIPRYLGSIPDPTVWEYHELVVPVKEISNFFTKSLNKLKEIGKPEDVRIVFWFDS